jgi:hypothetical protein
MVTGQGLSIKRARSTTIQHNLIEITEFLLKFRDLVMIFFLLNIFVVSYLNIVSFWLDLALVDQV